MGQLKKKDLDDALGLMNITLTELEECEDLKRLELTAVKKWHPDRAIGKGLSTEEIERYTRIFQKIPLCVEIFNRYRLGELEVDKNDGNHKKTEPAKPVRSPSVKAPSIEERFKTLLSSDLSNIEIVRLLTGLSRELRSNIHVSKKYSPILNTASYKLFTHAIEQNNIELAIRLLSIGSEAIQKKYTRYIHSLALKHDRRELLVNLLASDSPIPFSRFYVFFTSEKMEIAKKNIALQSLKSVVGSDKTLTKKYGHELDNLADLLFRESIQSGQLDLTRQLITNGVSGRTKKNNYYLSQALDTADRKLVKAILKAGANANEYLNKNTRWTLLMDRVKKDDLPFIKLLVKYGADVKATTRSPSAGWTALLEAVDNNRYDIVRFLLKSGGDPNYANASGISALKLARAHGDKEILKLLNKVVGSK